MVKPAYISVVVEKDGRLGKVKILMGSSYEINKEAIRVVKLMRKWEPGQCQGKNVRSRVFIPFKPEYFSKAKIQIEKN